MDKSLYPMIFKRKSFHKFPGKLSISNSELSEIEQYLKTLVPLQEGIRTAFKIVPRSETSCKTGEYCILFYSEKSDYYLYNMGYMIEQLDLWLASKDIGACWLGLARTKEKNFDGLDYVIMLGIEKVEATDFRKDFSLTKRKAIDEVLEGDASETVRQIADVARYAPSAFNTQPWRIRSTPECLNIFRVLGKRGIMPLLKVPFYNKIDVGIFMLFTELCLKHENISFHRTLLSDSSQGKENHVASYRLNFSPSDEKASK